MRGSSLMCLTISCAAAASRARPPSTSHGSCGCTERCALDTIGCTSREARPVNVVVVVVVSILHSILRSNPERVRSSFSPMSYIIRLLRRLLLHDTLKHGLVSLLVSALALCVFVCSVCYDVFYCFAASRGSGEEVQARAHVHTYTNTCTYFLFVCLLLHSITLQQS